MANGPFGRRRNFGLPKAPMEELDGSSKKPAAIDFNGNSASGAPVVAMCAAAASGAIVGFLLAGQIVVGGAAFVGISVGIGLGWTARKLVQ